MVVVGGAPLFTTVLCADWSKEFTRRAVYAAEFADGWDVRRVFRPAWTLSAVLAEARARATRGPVLVAVDAPFGVPRGYLEAVRVAHPSISTFPDLLTTSARWAHYFDAVGTATEWSLQRPFFKVPAGRGARTAFDAAARAQGVASLRRVIDVRTSANPLFITAGIPGSVGSATCDLWQELRNLLPSRDFAIWPFDGDLETLRQTHRVVLGEMYPRAAYATALLDGTPLTRPRLRIAKTHDQVRRAAVAQLTRADWVRAHGVTIHDVEPSVSNEDDFDACLTAAALLRCQLEGWPLHASGDAHHAVEGGILGSGSVNLSLPEQTFVAAHAGPLPAIHRSRPRPTSFQHD